MNLDNQLKTEGPMVFTSYETGNELDLDKMFSHLGPERTFAMANQLLVMVQEDYANAMNDVERQRGYNTAKASLQYCKDIQALYNDSYYSGNQTYFDKGWQEFCLENGAIKNFNGFKDLA